MIGSATQAVRVFFFLLEDDAEEIVFFVQLKLRLSGVVHRKTQSLIYSSMSGQTTQETAISAANNVMRFGRYPDSLKTQGITGMGIFGAKEKILGSNQLKMISRIAVVATTSDRKAHTYPTVKDVKNVLINVLISFWLGVMIKIHWNIGASVVRAIKPRFS